MPKYLKYTLLALLWGGVAAYLLYAGGKVRRHRAEQPVTRIEVEVVDSTSQLRLVSEATVRGWLARSGIKTVGEKIGAVRLDALERLIARNGFVADARVTVSYSGVLHVAVWQRTPLMRLLIDGYNSYVTEEGYLFAVPRASSVYVPVITGTYRPPFPASYVGYAADYRREQMQQIDDKIAELERAHDKLMNLARGREYSAMERSIDVQISRLRRMVEEDPAHPRYIQTVWGLGYVFVPDGSKA